MTRSKEALRAAKKRLNKPRGKFELVDLTDRACPSWLTRAYSNNRYMVMIDDNAAMTNDVTAIRAMVQRHDDTPIPNHWFEMQQIKNEVFGKEVVAIEYYPAESELINSHNIYWLWVLPNDILPRALTSKVV